MKKHRYLTWFAVDRMAVPFVAVLSLLFSVTSFANNPIVAENLNTGTRAWTLTQPGDDQTSQIKGFASAMSVTAGDVLQFYVTVNPIQDYSIVIYRMGYYQGLGGREVWRRNSIRGITQPNCPINSRTGMTRCPWVSPLEVEIDSNWVSGIYLAKLINDDGFENYIPFTVRDDARVADLVYQQPVTTYHAYNNYSNSGRVGKSAYDVNSEGPNTIARSPRAVRLSFDRPYENTGAYLYFLYEHELVMFIEEMGYDVSYVTNIDTHQSPSLLRGIKGFISAGHDEYWTQSMFTSVQAARDRGVDLAFTGANAVYWRVRFSPYQGRANRIMDIYKDGTIDPEPNPSRQTIRFRDSGRAEQSLVGVQYATYGFPGTARDLVARNTQHWVYQGTGIANADLIAGVVGGEIDRLFSDYASPDALSYTILGETPYQGVEPRLNLSQSVIYQAPSGAWVFASGTLVWNRNLTNDGQDNSVLRRMTRNILNRFVLSDSNQRPLLNMSFGRTFEQSERLTVKFDLSQRSSSDISFSVATLSGTARQGVDFYGAYRRLTIPAGQQSIEWSVQVIDDNARETPEYLTLRLWDAPNADIAQTRLNAWILDDDSSDLPRLTLSNAGGNESEGTLYVRAMLSAPQTDTVSFAFSTMTEGSAIQGVDYYGSYQRLTIPAGQTYTDIPVQLINDRLVEGPEEFQVQVFNADNAVIARRFATVYIASDDN